MEIEAEQSMNIKSDGEPRDGQRLRFESLPGVVRIHLPRKAPLLSANVGDE